MSRRQAVDPERQALVHGLPPAGPTVDLRLPSDVSYRWLRDDSQRFPEHQALLSPHERERVSEFLAEKRRHEFTLGRAAARSLLAERLDLPPSEVPLDVAADGGLVIQGSNLHVSISHSARQAVAVVGERPVGIDLETIKPLTADIRRYVYHEDDYALFDEKNVVSAEESSNVVKLIQKINQAFPVRAEQAAVIMEHLRNSPYKAVVCGDFNDTPLSYCYNQFNQILVDAYRNTSKGIGTTYAGRIPVGRIDYIFHSLKLGSKDFVIQQEALSDHYAIDCTIFVKPEE